MLPTLAVYVTPVALYSTLCSVGRKGLCLQGVAYARGGGDDLPWKELSMQLGEAKWSNVVLALDTSLGAQTTFPLDRETSEAIVRQQLELEIVQQFLSTPAAGYSADIYAVGPDIEGRSYACAMCVFEHQREIIQHCSGVFEEPVSITAAALSAIAALKYNYPDHCKRTCALVVLGHTCIDVLVMKARRVVFWNWAPNQDTSLEYLMPLIRSAVLSSGDLQSLFVTGVGLTRTCFAQIQMLLGNRFGEAFYLLDGFRMLECGLPQEICNAVAPLGHLFAPAVGAALSPFLCTPQWSFGVGMAETV